jgi:hypothetical protein
MIWPAGSVTMPGTNRSGDAMELVLTEEQQKALDASELPRLIDPRTQAAYVLLRENEYEALREIREEEGKLAAIRRIGLRNAILRMEDRASGYVIEAE